MKNLVRGLLPKTFALSFFKIRIDHMVSFFVSFLDQRFGWVPKPEQLKTREKDSQRRHQAAPR